MEGERERGREKEREGERERERERGKGGEGERENSISMYRSKLQKYDISPVGTGLDGDICTNTNELVRTRVQSTLVTMDQNYQE